MTEKIPDTMNVYDELRGIIVTIDCNNCAFMFYDPNDPHDYQKCSVIKMEEKPQVNTLILKLINSGVLDALGCSACEYFQFKYPI